MRIRSGLLLAAAFICFSGISLVAQLRYDGEPVVLSQPLDANIPTFLLTPPDVAALQAEDAFNEANRIPGPLRYGVPLSTEIDVVGMGSRNVTPDNIVVARVRIISPGARSLGLVFSSFDLPEGGKLFLYDENLQTIFGAYDRRDRNPETGELAIEPFTGSQPDSVILEISFPASAPGVAALVSQVIHDYRGIRSLENALDSQQGPGTEGSCPLVDVNCPDGDPFPNQKRATVRTLFGGGLCSASLINNTANDGTQYVYTANHCGQGSTTVFRFKYQKPGCSSGTAPTTNNISGAVLLANDVDTDGRLLRITNTIPTDFNPYFGGWSRATGNLTFGMSMHHPGGGPKKISIDTNGGGQITADFIGIGPVKCWSMNFQVGSTEGGSSGGPLFDQNDRIRGALTGGPDPNCTIAYYGRFFSFWNETSIAQYLDPLGSGVTAIDGFDPFGGPPVPPVISSITPGSVEAFLPPNVTLGGSGFSSVTSVKIGSTTLFDPSFTVTSDTSLFFAPPTPTSLGTVAVTVSGPNGTSNAVNLSYVATDPPKLSASFLAFQTQPFTWSFGGGPGDTHYLLVALSPTTFPFSGFDILLNLNIINIQALDSIGVGSLTLVIPASASGLTFYSQGVTLDAGGFVGASNVTSTLIL
ncbi:MAG TPA: IPT/TIG domain-containing protein [Planctomycetota bacterium]|nr:IPT/TIG domain-containing protein [Planctomycetota bacterium]